MKTLPISGKVWFSFISFVIKICMVSVFFGIQAYYYLDASKYRDWTVEVPAMNATNSYARPGYVAAFVLLAVMGEIERRSRRMKQAIGDYIFAVLALCFWSFSAPLN